MDAMEHEPFQDGPTEVGDLLPELIAPAAPLVEPDSDTEAEAGSGRRAVQSRLKQSHSRTQLTTSDRLEYLWRTHNYISGNFRLADAKAAVTIVVATSLIGSLYAAGLHKSFICGPPTCWSPLAWLAASSFLLLALAVLFGAWTLYPRLWNTKQVDYIYWEQILAHSGGVDYWEAFHSKSAEALARSLSTNIHTIALLCKHKYRALRVATWFALLGGGVGAILLLIRK
jgi:hypothetical protein